MKIQIRKIMIEFAVFSFLVGFLGALPSFCFIPKAFADDDAGVAGCNAVTVDPNASLEDQQDICTNAEHFPSSSCAAGGHGTCSSPKTNGTLLTGTHCICLEQDAAEPAS